MNLTDITEKWLLAIGAFVAAFLGGLGIAAVYAPTMHKTKDEARPFATTLILLSMLTSGAAMMIGDSMARAFGLLGALSIVRFRTVVDDTRDTAFVVFAVVVGMACGSFDFRIAGTALATVGAAAIYLGAKNRPAADALAEAVGARFKIVLRAAVGRDLESVVAPVFAAHVAKRRCIGIATSRQGASLDYRFEVRLNDPARAPELAQALNALDGVQHVEIEAD